MNLAQQVARFPHLYGDLFPVVFDPNRLTTFVYEQDFKIKDEISPMLFLVLGSDKDQIKDLIPLEVALVVAFWNGWQRFKKTQDQIIKEISLRYKGVSWCFPEGRVDTVHSRMASKVFQSTLNAVQTQFKTLMQELTRENVRQSSIPYMTAREYLLQTVNVDPVLMVPKQDEK